ncbi:lipopolysaccharide N-acetylglucosaminyl transferase [Pandoraea fibrosis]|uniref:Lipopolysaccharide N-acetylglucosaminyl transferase n=1 Tax=Pandoraea fibrosis TaxID=1891094 RepID=A0A5E4SCZ6_9BURK|nr:lipopolysaccharide N-acetylglucosaminyl transferase [Pandoraea fibrosis]VVD73497.1 lipopolysaccharide N-acetylglucosaminyl transferase [Pandoraea fibrosis]
MPERTSQGERMTTGRRRRQRRVGSGLRLLQRAFALGLAVLAVAAQAQALHLVIQSEVWQAALADGGVPRVSMGAVLAWQAMAALLAGGFVSCVLSAGYRARHSAFWHIALITFFLPGAGLCVVLGVFLLGYLFPPPREAQAAGRVTPPGFISHLVARVRHGAGMRLRARLRNLRGERDDRVAALISVQALPSRVTSEIARDLLADPVEEVRLLAYGILDGMEKRIMQQIYAMRERHAAAQDEDERAHACRCLAQLYWELIYQNLVRGEVLRFTLARVEQFARDTLEQHEDDASMWYLLGRCALLRETPDVAEMYLRHAQFHSFPTERLLPWLAEAAFQKRRYDRVSQLLGGLGASATGAKGATASPAVQPAVRFWTR